MSTQNGTGRIYPTGIWSGRHNGERFVLKHSDMDYIRSKLLSGVHHDVVGREYERSGGWSYQLGTMLGLTWDRKNRVWKEAAVAVSQMPVTEKDQKVLDRINVMVSAIEYLEAQLAERETKGAEQEYAYQLLTTEYETVKAANDRMAQHIEELEQQIRALTVDQEQEAAIEEAYDRAGTLLERIKRSWAF